MKFFFIFSIIIFISCPLYSNAQEIKIEEISEQSTDISARTNPRFDLNGDPCALLKIQLAAQNADFEGNVVDIVEKKGEYWVYMVSQSRKIKVLLQNFLPCEISFENLPTGSLAEKITYKIRLSLPMEMIINTSSIDSNIGVTDTVAVNRTWEGDNFAVLADSLYKQKDYSQAMDMALKGSALGNPKCDDILARIYGLGLGCQVNEKEAQHYITNSINGGYIPAYYHQYYFYRNGIIKPWNKEKCLSSLYTGAQFNDDMAQSELGYLLLNGEHNFIDPDVSKAVKWYSHAAHQNNEVAQYNLALCYLNGVGVAKNEKVAFDWANKSFENECPAAYFLLAKLYQDGTGVVQDRSKAIEILSIGTEKDIAECYRLLALSYERGLGVVRDTNKAMELYINASEKGDLNATEQLYYIYRDGDYILGIEKNARLAQIYKERLANQQK